MNTREFYETIFSSDRRAFFLPLIGGDAAMVDIRDAGEVDRFNWRLLVDERTGAKRAFRWGGRKERSRVYLHRHLLRAGPGQFVDHVNRDGLDNRRDNLRLCTKAQNAWNSRRNIVGKTSRFKGVSSHRKHVLGRPWQATITVHSKQQFLGYYATQEEAASAYDLAAIRFFGEFALTNFPRERYV